MTDKKNNKSVLIGAAFLMATSAIGPGFLTQTATFTEQLKADFGFVILVSLALSLIAQLNIWRIIGVSGLRGQEIANKVLPGLGYVIAFLVALGGLAFNIGNVGGAALGLNVIFGDGISTNIMAAVSAALAIFVFLNKNAGAAMDQATKILGSLMILLIAIVAFTSNPPLGDAVKQTFVPTQFPTLAIITLIGGTVGGYIPFSGGHRLLDAGISGEENLKDINQSAITGMSVAAIMRVLLFVAILGVVSTGAALDPSNPAASAFQQSSLGNIAYKFFGFVLFAASLTSIVGAAYTSVSFLKTFSEGIKKNENLIIIAFIAISTLMLITIGKPAALMVIAGSLNGLILPLTLAIMLIASQNKKIVGDYKHPVILLILGIIVVAATAYMGVQSLSGLSKLFQ